MIQKQARRFLGGRLWQRLIEGFLEGVIEMPVGDDFGSTLHVAT